jgi:hypothetical protein
VTPDEDLRAFITNDVPGFDDMGQVDKVRLFAWLQHHLFKRDRFSTGNINACYSALSRVPGNTSQFLKTLAQQGELLKDSGGYRCEGQLRATYDTRYGVHQITLTVRDMVKDLINVLPELGEKDIFQEALICLKHDAGRATIIMVWNIAFYHLCQYILKHKLAVFNNTIPSRYPKKWKVTDMPLISKYEDFGDEMAEREVIEVANSAGIITGTMHKAYVEKLGKRNDSAHPSQAHVTQIQAEGFIDDLINNTVRLLTI